ncbi:hypothetical protein V5O48_009020 [Marasmius crinis-equi]|uniref:CENP-V/GFA domain-containing protein n=1 Tax=Marasmius crinis-equi TaxID=585013 RepID=A0ABR3FCG3_9AGAR
MITPVVNSTTRNGSCLCKGVKLQIIGEPLNFFACHCTGCKKASGTAFLSNVWFHEQNVIVNEGSDLVKSYNDSGIVKGRNLRRHFCSKCGSNLFIRLDTEGPEKDLVILQASTVDDPHDWQPEKELDVESRWDWVEVKVKADKTNVEA